MVLHGMPIAVPLLPAPTEVLMLVAYCGSLSDPSSLPDFPVSAPVRQSVPTVTWWENHAPEHWDSDQPAVPATGQPRDS